MSFYRTGAIAFTNGSAAVTGTGTDFINGAAVGECVQVPDGNLYEILSIQSATALTLGQVYLGATASGQAYSIIPTQSYIRDLASQAATLVNNYSATNTTALKTSDADKTTLVDADKLAMRDSVSGTGRLLTWANLKATLASWLNGGTLPISATTISASSAVNTVALNASGMSQFAANVALNNAAGAYFYNPGTTQWYSWKHASTGLFSLTSSGGGQILGVSDAGLAVTGTGSFSGSVILGGGSAGVPANVGEYNTKAGFIVRTTNPSVMLGVGYTANDNPTIQSFDAANSARTLDINPFGGAVKVGGGLAVTGGLIATGVLTTSGLKEDAAGNLGLGVVPSAWGTNGPGQKVLQSKSWAISSDINSAYYTNNVFFDGYDWKRIRDNFAFLFQMDAASGRMSWNLAGFDAIGTSASFIQAMTLDASGNLLLGVTAGAQHIIAKDVAEGGVVLNVSGLSAGATIFQAGATLSSTVATCQRVNSNSVSGRSINAGGTFNASGADYAEYERNNGLIFTKGSIVGFKADGTLTNVFDDAIRFAVKSTNPSYVGGDTWGTADQVGKRPDEPQRITDKTEQREVTPAIAATETEPSVEATYETVILEAGDTDAEWETKRADYTAAKATFEAALEAARQQVDRIAYSGKVPCNVMDATPGGYIIAIDNAGAIAGQYVADPDFAQYKKAVGRVNRILPDGRCEVAVIIH